MFRRGVAPSGRVAVAQGVRAASAAASAASVADTALIARVRAACFDHITSKAAVPPWADCEAILALATEALRPRANVQPITKAECPQSSGVTVWGDVHGQGRDVLRLMKSLGVPSATNPFLFNGDLVDRGPNGSEIVVLLASYIAEDPTSVWINRGNHEEPSCYLRYGFANEVLTKYTVPTRAGVSLRCYQDLFNAASIAHVVDNAVFVVHGGLPKVRETTIDELNKANRFVDEAEKPFHLMLWSDPDETRGQRGAVFSKTDVKRFLDVNKLKMVVRSHEVMTDGYKIHHDGLSATVFSAPGYCGAYNNMAAVARFEFGDGGKPTWTQFPPA